MTVAKVTFSIPISQLPESGINRAELFCLVLALFLGKIEQPIDLFRVLRSDGMGTANVTAS
ncbi:MAG TPA: hypothetical protein VN843_23375 [Anaerolineales bacterium]|nr:hypothetical protein [Anaerolineales bacterium]